MADYDYTNVSTGEHFTDSDMEDVFEEWLDDFHGEVYIAGHSFYAGRALRNLDEIAFREEFNNWIGSEIDEGNYAEYDDSPECEDCGESMSADEVTEALANEGRLVCESCVEDMECDICGLLMDDCAERSGTGAKTFRAVKVGSISFFAGGQNLYRLDPPKYGRDVAITHVVVSTLGGPRPETVVFPSDKNGYTIEGVPGILSAHDTPVTDEVALRSLGYRIA